MNRFVDIACFSTRLTPVNGYLSAKLVSLEEALRPIETHIDNLTGYITTAKEHCRHPSEHGLSHDESASVYIYTMEWGAQTLNRLLNQALGKEDQQALEVWFPYLKLFDTALDKLPTVKETVWRGFPENIEKHFTKNQLVTWWPISSCSSSVNVISTMLENDANSTLFMIEAVNGKKVSGYTQHEQEAEVILKMGTQLRVQSDSLTETSDSHVVHLIEVNHAGNGGRKGNKWKRNALTVAGGHGEGPTLNQFSYPYGICVTEKNNIFVADWGNDRIVRWTCKTKVEAIGADRSDTGRLSEPTHTRVDKQTHSRLIPDQASGQIVIKDIGNWDVVVDHRRRPQLSDRDKVDVSRYNKGQTRVATSVGGNRQRKPIDLLAGPTDVIVDQGNRSLIIADRGNRRVVRWFDPRQLKKPILIKSIDCYGLAMYKHRYLYVSDYAKNEVKRWKEGETQGTVVAGGNGKGDQLNQLSYPTYICVDKDQSVYVSDTDNHRVMKWKKGANEGVLVAGGNGSGSSLRQLSSPRGVLIDRLGHICVADCGNHRVVRWREGEKQGAVAVGGNGQGKRSNQLDGPHGLSIDAEGNLYVADFWNDRIQKFESIDD